MMKELHQIRAKHSQESKVARGRRGLALEESAEKFVASYGYRLVRTKQGTRRLVKIT